MKQLKQLFANFRKDLDTLKLKISKADAMEMEEEDDEEEVEACPLETYQYGISYVHDRISSLESYFYSYINEHNKGHLPPINSVEQMRNALEVLGLGEEYEIQPRMIYSKEGQLEKVIVELTKKKV